MDATTATETVDAQFEGAHRVEEFAKTTVTDFAPVRRAEEFTITKYLAVELMGEDKVDRKKDYELTDFQSLKPLEGKRVADIACGSGRYTRKWAEIYGAESVVAVDISEGQIRAAARFESEHPLNIQYAVGDIRSPTILDVMKITEANLCDVATAVFLDPYLNNATEVQTMLANIYAMLKPGGFFIQCGHSSNKEIVDTAAKGAALSGVRVSAQDPEDGCLDRKGFAEIKTGHGDEDWLRLNGWFWHPSTYAKAAKEVGFREPVIHELELSPEDRRELGKATCDSITEHYAAITVFRKPM